MITIDGSQHSGSGTLVRYSVALAALLHEPVRVINVKLVVFAALAHGRSTYTVPEVTDHVLSNLWLVRQFGVAASVTDAVVAVDGLALR
jgi:RNA 3'-terminal phosphate cyclase